MKRFFAIVALLSLGFVACSKYEQQDALPEVVPYGDLKVGFAEDTRTYVLDNKFLRWHQDDKLTVFYGNSANTVYKFNGKTGDSDGTFSYYSQGTHTGDSKLDNIMAIYPVDLFAEVVASNMIYYTMPIQQFYQQDSFGVDTNPMVAVSKDTTDDKLMFYNLCGYLKVNLYGCANVKSITLYGNNYEQLSGNCFVTANYGQEPSINMASDASESILLDCGDGVALDATKPTTFWFVVPPTTFEKGFTIAVTDVNGNSFWKTTTSKFSIARNQVQPMEDLECNIEQIEQPDPDEVKSMTITYRVTTPGNILLHACPASSQLKFEGGDSQIVKVDYGDGTVEDADYLNYTHKYYTPGDYDVTIYYKGNPTDFARDSRSVFGCNHYANDPYEWNECTPVVKIEIPETFEGLYFTLSHLEEITFIGDCAALRNGLSAIQANCPNLKRYNSIYASEDGRFMIREGVLLACARAGVTMSEYAIPEGVHTIAKYAFESVSDIKKVTLPSTLKEIQYDAFASTLIESIVLPEGLTTIGGQAFRWSALKSIEVPASVTSIGADVFAQCQSMTSAVVNGSVLGEGMFRNCSTLADLTINGQLYELPKSCFAGTSIKSINIPSSIVSIGGNALSGCKQLQSVTFAEDSMLRAIDSDAFAGCSSLKSIEIPKGVTYIDDNAFSGCSALESVALSESLTYIGIEAFDRCSALKNVTFTGNKLTNIGMYAFDECGSLETLELPEGVVTLAIGAFRNCTSLTSLSLPSTLKTIDAQAFENVKINEIRIPDSVTTIGSAAFKGCGNEVGTLKLYLGSGLQNLAEDALNQTMGYTYIESKSPAYVTTDDNILLMRASDGYLMLCAGYGHSDIVSYVVPQTIAGVTVTGVGVGLFSSAPFESIELPATITTIRELSMLSSSLKSVYIRAVEPPLYYGSSMSFTQGGFSMVGGSTKYPINTSATVYVPKGSETAYSDKRYPNVVGYDF